MAPTSYQPTPTRICDGCGITLAMLSCCEINHLVRASLATRGSGACVRCVRERRQRMGLREKMRRPEDTLRDHLDTFDLEDGSHFYFDASSPERFLHSMSCPRAQGEGKITFPEPPSVVAAIA